MITLGTQYYRAPFPENRYWEQDLKQMKESGLNTVQLWVLWGWVEAKQGTYNFSDYDRLVDIAQKYGLGVVLSTIAEIHPYWIHDAVPGSEMVTNMGVKVVSSNRGECHYGITPGGCFDHPGVWERMQSFIRATAERFGKAPHLRGWDAWNELRWNVNADGLVCYCDNTLATFRAWLEMQYGTLDGLNKAWRRRYSSFKEVMPGKMVGRPYTEMMAFNHFITARANAHAKLRYDTIKTIDKIHPVTVHGAQPSPYYAGDMNAPHYVMPLDRGNDWSFVENTDGMGFSSFPKWGNQDDTTFAVRVSIGASAATSNNKRMWLSELQGGRSSIGFVEPHLVVDAKSQQRWLWNGIAGGADTVLFWCWRDEVFGCESNGFGIIGNDGRRDERVVALKRTGKMLVDHEALLAAYKPLKGSVGVLFSPQTYYLYGAQDGKAGRVFNAMEGYCRALSRLNIPYTVVEEEHLAVLDGIKLLFIPKTMVIAEKTEKVIEAFINNGGTVVCESEFGAFDTAGVYRYPEDRFITRLTGIREIGRRNLPKGNTKNKDLPAPAAYTINGIKASLFPAQWITPLTGSGTVLARHDEGALALETQCGNGRVIMIGTYLGENNRDSLEMERFIGAIVAGAKIAAPVSVQSPVPSGRNFVQIIAGKSSDKRVVFVFFPRECECKSAALSMTDGFTGVLADAVSGENIRVTNGRCTVKNTDLAFAMLIES
ncbi:MAG: beta-galactosidase [Spirochaetes bacterium]|nr:beta-galactosidase [Spirochaetota bacterium]